jgi:hypothetical protein
LSPSTDITDIRQSKSETWSTNNSSHQFKIPASLCSWRGLLPRNRILLHTLYYTDSHISLTKLLDSEQVCETGILLQAQYNKRECQLFFHYCLGLFLTLFRRKSVGVINSNLVKLYAELPRTYFFKYCFVTQQFVLEMHIWKFTILFVMVFVRHNLQSWLS